MPAATLDLSSAQMEMPGMPIEPVVRRPLNAGGLASGQVVQYHGRVKGGPHFGISGTVVATRPRQALVDMGSYGRWNIPYYLLSVPDTVQGGRDALQVA